MSWDSGPGRCECGHPLEDHHVHTETCVQCVCNGYKDMTERGNLKFQEEALKLAIVEALRKHVKYTLPEDEVDLSVELSTELCM